MALELQNRLWQPASKSSATSMKNQFLRHQLASRKSNFDLINGMALLDANSRWHDSLVV
jgi:hypothetical protein